MFIKNKTKKVIYNKIEDYFVDEEQLKRYKKKVLEPQETIILSNNNCNSTLNFDISKFGDVVLIFQNCSFSNLSIESELYNPYTTIKFKDCKIIKGDINVGQLSNLELEHCYVENINGTAEKIIVNDLITSSEKICHLKLGDKTTYSVTVNNANEKIATIIDVTSQKLELNNFTGDLKSNCSFVKLLNSIARLGYVENLHTLSLDNSVISPYFSKYKTINIPLFITNDSSKIYDLHLAIDTLCIRSNSHLLPSNVKFDISNLLILSNNSSIDTKNMYDCIIISDNIYLNSNSIINVNNMKHKNDTNSCVKISGARLKDEREKLVKTLGLVLEKYNKQIKNL